MPTWKSSVPDITGLSLEKQVESLLNHVIEQDRKLSWITSKLDSKNVKRLDTNETSIKSADGETIIDGPVLEMYDKQAVPVLRLKQGYDSVSGDFIYALYNEAGSQTVGIDSSGNATFTGAISASTITGGTITGGAISGGTIDGTTITGGTIQTAATGRRITITGNELYAYDANGTARLEIHQVAGGADPNYYDLWFRGQLGNHEGTISGTDNQFNVGAENNLAIGGGLSVPGGKVAFISDVDFQNFSVNFSSAAISGLETDTSETHNHGIPDGTVLAKDGGGTVTFVASGSHSHSVT